MVAAFDYCLHGRGGAAPSIDTAMHGLVDAAHVDHLHPDSGIASPPRPTASADQGVLRRPGRLGAVAAARLPARPRHRRDPRANPEAIGVILGGHGITAWGETERGVRGQLAGDHPHGRGVPRRARPPEPFGAVVPASRRSPDAERGAGGGAGAAASAGSRRPTARRSGTSPTATSCSTSAPERSCRRWPRWARRAPDHFLRTKVRPLVLDLPADGAARGRRRAAASCTRSTATTTAPTTSATPTPTRRRCAAPTRRSCSCPASACSRSARTSRPRGCAGEFYVNAINVMRGAESVSTYAPIPEAEKFRIEYWALEEAKLQRLPEAEAAGHPGRVRDRRGSGIGRAIAHRLAAEGACVVVADVDAEAASNVAREIGTTDVAVAVTVDVTDAEQVAARSRAVLRLRRRRPRGQQRRPVDLEAVARDDRAAIGTCSTT